MSTVATVRSLTQGCLAEATDEIHGSYGNLIFIGCFFLALIAVGIWWLRRG